MRNDVIKMLRTDAEARKQKALTSLKLLMDNPAGIGDHSTGDFYNNANDALAALDEADGQLQTIDKYFPIEQSV